MTCWWKTERRDNMQNVETEAPSAEIYSKTCTLAFTPTKRSTKEPTHKPGTIFMLPECCIWRRDTQLHNCMMWGSAKPQLLWVDPPKKPLSWHWAIVELTELLPCGLWRKMLQTVQNSGILILNEPCRGAGWDKWATRGCLIILRDSKPLLAKLMCQMPNLMLKGHQCLPMGFEHWVVKLMLRCRMGHHWKRVWISYKILFHT